MKTLYGTALAVATTALACAATPEAATVPTRPEVLQAVPLVDAPSAVWMAATGSSSSFDPDAQATVPQQSSASTAAQSDTPPKEKAPLAQQKRVFGILPNYTSVSGGTRPAPAGWKTDAIVSYKQSTDYVGILYTLATSGVAEAQNSHPSLETENGGNAVYWAYAWRGLVDRTSQTLQGSLFFPALLHEDTRYFAEGRGSITHRTLHAISSVVVAHSYSGRPVFNLANLAGKAGAQALSTQYYPSGSEDFGVLAEKFAYACLRQAGFTVLREFSPDIAQHLHRHKQAAAAPNATGTAQP